MIEIQNLAKDFSDVWAVDHISLEIRGARFSATWARTGRERRPHSGC